MAGFSPGRSTDSERRSCFRALYLVRFFASGPGPRLARPFAADAARCLGVRTHLVFSGVGASLVDSSSAKVGDMGL